MVTGSVRDCEASSSSRPPRREKSIVRTGLRTGSPAHLRSSQRRSEQERYDCRIIAIARSVAVIDGGKDAAPHRRFEQLARAFGSGMLRLAGLVRFLSPKHKGRNGQMPFGGPVRITGRSHLPYHWKPTLPLQNHRAADAGGPPSGHAPSRPSASGREPGLGMPGAFIQTQTLATRPSIYQGLNFCRSFPIG
jgi:hypothetical protein